MQRLEALVGGSNRIASVETIVGSGSNRRYYRLHLTDGNTVIGVIGTCIAENEAFIYLSEYFASRSLPVPRVIAVSADRKAYIQEDLGSTSLYDCLDNSELIGKAIDMLPRFQLHGAIGLDFERCYPVAEMDHRSVMWDLNYFKYCFLKPLCTEIDEPRLETEFEHMTDALLSTRPLGFMVRDFQSRNVMIRDGEPYLIDFQGGRRGPVHYDVASFLWQARARFSPAIREQMVGRYIAASGIDSERFRAELPLFVVFRMLQVLGAYGFRGLYEHKAAFMQQIPIALATLSEFISATEYPYLSELTRHLTAQFQIEAMPASDGRLTIEVLSFSYKKGLPADNSGNGGGFVFDCRALHNPGRYDRYKPLTGRDPEVIEFLEDNGEILGFLDHCYSLVDSAVERYVERGFTHLQVAFGCTGGRHRSLYSADHMAAHLREKFAGKPIDVTLLHREHPHIK